MGVSENGVYRKKPISDHLNAKRIFNDKPPDFAVAYFQTNPTNKFFFFKINFYV